MAERTKPRIPPGSSETENDSGVFLTDIKLKTTDRSGQTVDFPVVLRRNSNTGNFQYEYKVGLETYVLAVGNPQSGFRLNPEDNPTVKDYLTPVLAGELVRSSTTAKQTTKELVAQNTTIPETQQQILNSPYYKDVEISSPVSNTEGPIDTGPELNNIEITANNKSKKFGVMRYPIGSENTKLDYIKFTPFNPVPSKFGGYKDEKGNKVGEIGQFVKKEYIKDSIGSIYLPIQPNINDTNTVEWGEDRMGLLDMFTANLSLAFTGGAAISADNFIEQIGPGVGENKETIEKAVKAAASSTLAKSGSNVFTRVSGAMVNPNLELLFKSPKIRTFTYTIKLTPRSEPEANMVRKIIRCFKQNMAPRLAANNYFLQTPNVFDIEYIMNGNQPHKGLNKIKTSALQSCTVNYTPSNFYAPYVDGTMTSYELTLQFQELLPIYDEDYIKEFDENFEYVDPKNMSTITIGY